MNTTTKSTLFTDLVPEESVAISGGDLSLGYGGNGHDSYHPKGEGTVVNFDLNSYLFILGAGVVFGQQGLTPSEQQFAFETAIATGPRVEYGLSL